jgi:predicted dehydrogenase
LQSIDAGGAMEDTRIRFAVIGLGYIAQVAVLPAFEHARESCKLVALVSSDATKLTELGKRYDVEVTCGYDDLEQVLRDARVDAAYIALPNSMHREMTERCARAGVHVLCEKPMATTVEDCEAMIFACREHEVKLMIAYRLHFESANLRAVELARSGELGDPRFFTSTFSQQVREGDIRTQKALGGGALFDAGIYCVNAARYLFRSEPDTVIAFQSMGHEGRLHGVDETTTAVLRFPGDRLAQITCSQGAADVDSFRLVGTHGDLRVEPAYTYAGELVHTLTVDGKTSTQMFPKSDQFAPELVYFAQCITRHMDPEPSGEEGLADVRILAAIAQSAKTGALVELGPFERAQRPELFLELTKPPVEKPDLVHV